MKINEVIKQVDLSKRAIKYYEEKGLLSVVKDTNGYRNYTDENITTLKTISIYRKLGICIDDIRLLLKNTDYSILDNVLHEKEQDLETKAEELNALRDFIKTHNIDQAYKELNYRAVADAISDAVPGFTGYCFLHHFLPYLQIKIVTEEQQKAYDNIIEFWDNTTIKMPLPMKLTSWIMYLILPKTSIDTMVQKMEQTILLYTNPTPEQYKTLKKQVASGVRLKNNPLYKYSPAGIAQRKFMKELQNKGYNDIFIPNMIKLSPEYKNYHDALMDINNRICSELNLYYDTNFNLVQKK